MVLMVVFGRYRMPFDAHGCVSTLLNVTSYAKISIERHKGIDECRFIKMNAFSSLSLRLALMIVHFLVMNSKRCILQTWGCTTNPVSNNEPQFLLWLSNLRLLTRKGLTATQQFIKLWQFSVHAVEAVFQRFNNKLPKSFFEVYFHY